MEARAVLKALQLALARNAHPLICSIDVEIIFLAVIKPIFFSPLDTVTIIITITILQSQLPSLLFELVNRQGNKIVDMVAKLCLRSILLFDLLGAALLELVSLL